MKIISKYKDYYDGVQSYGQDSTTVFERNTQLVVIPEENGIEEHIKECSDHYNIRRIRSISKEYEALYLCNILIGFCGKLYKSICIQESGENRITKPIIFHSKIEAILYFKEHENSLYLDDLRRRHGLTAKQFKNSDWADFIPKPIILDGDINKIFHDLKTPIFLYPKFRMNAEEISRYTWLGKLKLEENRIITNPNLKEVNFQKVKDAYQCYQEIEQYLNGVLGNIERDDDNRTDIEKVRSHGFDDKYGFRTRKK